MKKLVSILLLALMLSQILDRVWLIVAFQFNKDYIIENFCEQRQTAVNACQGKCHLKKQIQKAENQEETHLPQNLKSTFEVSYCCADWVFQMDRKPLKTLLKDFNGFYLQAKVLPFSSSIFHPPKV